MSVRVAFVFNHWMQSFKAAYDNTCLGQVLSRTSLTLRAGPTAVRKDQFVGFTTRLHCPRLPLRQAQGHLGQDAQVSRLPKDEKETVSNPTLSQTTRKDGAPG